MTPVSAHSSLHSELAKREEGCSLSLPWCLQTGFVLCETATNGTSLLDAKVQWGIPKREG